MAKPLVRWQESHRGHGNMFLHKFLVVPWNIGVAHGALDLALAFCGLPL